MQTCALIEITLSFAGFIKDYPGTDHLFDRVAVHVAAATHEQFSIFGPQECTRMVSMTNIMELLASPQDWSVVR